MAVCGPTPVAQAHAVTAAGQGMLWSPWSRGPALGGGRGSVPQGIPSSLLWLRAGLAPRPAPSRALRLSPTWLPGSVVVFCVLACDLLRCPRAADSPLGCGHLCAGQDCCPQAAGPPRWLTLPHLPSASARALGGTARRVGGLWADASCLITWVLFSSFHLLSSWLSASLFSRSSNTFVVKFLSQTLVSESFPGLLLLTTSFF